MSGEDVNPFIEHKVRHELWSQERQAILVARYLRSGSEEESISQKPTSEQKRRYGFLSFKD
jgi:hypothetical protein